MQAIKIVGWMSIVGAILFPYLYWRLSTTRWKAMPPVQERRERKILSTAWAISWFVLMTIGVGIDFVKANPHLFKSMPN